MSDNDYRFDNRTKKEFIKDIKQAHIKELEIAIRICIDKHEKDSKWPTLIPTGTDAMGDFVESHKVVSDPDFYIEPDCVEITCSNPICNKVFHQKVNKVTKCLEHEYALVFANGLGQADPKYLYINATQLATLTELSKATYGIKLHPTKNSGISNKEAYRYNISWFDEIEWHNLPEIDAKKIPSDYSKYLDLIHAKK